MRDWQQVRLQAVQHRMRSSNRHWRRHVRQSRCHANWIRGRRHECRRHRHWRRACLARAHGHSDCPELLLLLQLRRTAFLRLSLRRALASLFRRLTKRSSARRRGRLLVHRHTLCFPGPRRALSLRVPGACLGFRLTLCWFLFLTTICSFSPGSALKSIIAMHSSQ